MYFGPYKTYLLGMLPSLVRGLMSSAPEPFHVGLSARVPRMMELVEMTQLPEREVYPEVNSSSGITLDALTSLKDQWSTSFDWEREQDAINEFSHYTTTVEGLRLHFIHEPSEDPEAIPLILIHGWPSSFLEFLAVIEPLRTNSNGTDYSRPFNIVVPSLPGFAFSDPAPAGWTREDTARIFNTLMTNVLGYETYAVHATDWGSPVAEKMYGNYNQTVRALHLSFLPRLPLGREQLAELNISLDAYQEAQMKNAVLFEESGFGYFELQSTRPNTIGLALYDNPIGQLAWMAEKYIDGSDPRRGTGPSVLTDNEILRTVALYYLSGTHISAAYMYFQNTGAFQGEYERLDTDAPLLYSAFPYNLGPWPDEVIAMIGNHVNSTYHDFGGHFNALDNPPAIIEDVRKIAAYWE